MSPAMWFALLVACIGVPAMFVHRTAAALVLAWLVNLIPWLSEGNPLPIPLYLLTDIVAFVFIWSWRANLADHLVLGLYPICWAVYVCAWIGKMEPYAVYWVLYWLAAAQFIIAGPWSALFRNRTMIGRRIKIQKPILAMRWRL